MKDSQFERKSITADVPVHRCIHCVGHKGSKLLIETNVSYYKQPYPRWIVCICGDCGYSGPHGYSDADAIKNWNEYCEKESAYGQAVLAAFQASHR